MAGARNILPSRPIRIQSAKCEPTQMSGAAAILARPAQNTLTRSPAANSMPLGVHGWYLVASFTNQHCAIASRPASAIIGAKVLSNCSTTSLESLVKIHSLTTHFGNTNASAHVLNGETRAMAARSGLEADCW